MKSNSLLFIIFALMSMSCTEKKSQPTSEEVIEIIHKVNNYWQTNNPKHGNAFWHRAVYHTGNMTAYALTEKAEYLAFSEAWAEHNQWKGAISDDTLQWRYSYGERPEYVLFGDWQTCFQV